MISIFPSEQVGPKPGPSERPAKAVTESQDSSEKPSFASMMAKDDDAQAPTEAVRSKGQPSAVKGESNVPNEAPLAEGVSLVAQTEAPELEAAPVPATETAETDKGLKVEIAATPTEGLEEQRPQTIAASEIKAATSETDLKLTQTLDNEKAVADPELSVKSKPDLVASPDVQKDVIVKAQANEGDVQGGAARIDPTLAEGDDTLRIQRNTETADVPRAELKDASARQIADPQTSADKQLLGAEKITAKPVSREAAMTTIDPLITVAQSQSTSTQTGPTGLTPTAPAVQVASPNEITSIILNNLKSGVEPREQMIIQLDPPELGRVSIDFKFDAQGVQQITVTAENPEALKRLREMHFELTEALKEQGLSDKNMSFQQESREQQDQPNWNAPERAGAMMVASAHSDLSASAPILRTASGQAATDRLDLTL